MLALSAERVQGLRPLDSNEDIEVPRLDEIRCVSGWYGAGLTSWFLTPFPNKRNQGSLEKWLIQGLMQDRHKMSLEHLVQEKKKKGSVK